MYIVALTHIEADGNDYTKVMSKHRSRSAAIKAMLKKMASFYGWQSVKEFREELEDEYEEAKETGKFKVEMPTMDSTGFWSVVEV